MFIKEVGVVVLVILVFLKIKTVIIQKM